MPGTKKSGKEISVYLPYEMLERLERVRGDYLTNSKFILWCLNQVLDGKIEKIPHGVEVGNQAP